MAKASDIPLLKQEKTLLKEIAQLKKDGAGASKKDAAVMKKRAEDAKAELDALRMKNTEAFSYLELSRQLIKSAKKHSNILINQKGIYTGIKSVATSISLEAAKNDKLSKKLVKGYQGVLDISQSIMLNTRAIGTEEFQKVNITRKIIELKKLEGEVTEKGRKKDLAKAIQLLELQKEAQNIMEQMHNSAQSAAKTLVSPFKKVVDTLGSVPLIGGLIQSSFGGVLDEWQESLSARIGKAMSGGLDKAPADVGADAEKAWKKETKGQFKGKGHQKARGKAWAEEKKKREESAEYSEEELAAAGKKSKLLKANLAVLGAVGFLWAKIGKYAMDTGLSFSQVAALGPQLLINSKAVAAFAEEFGTVGELSTSLAIDLKKQTIQYGVAAKDAAKLMKLQQGMTGATKESISADLPGMYKDARKAGVSPAKLMENMAGSSEFLSKYVGGSVKEMGKFAIEAAKSGVSLQAIEASMKGALDWETSIGKEMEASMLLGREINLDKFRQLSFNEDTTGALNEQKRILRSLGPLDQLRLDQKEALGEMFNTEFGNLVSLTREQDILNNAVNEQTGIWATITGAATTTFSTVIGFMPGLLSYGSQLSMMFGEGGLGGAIKALGGHLKTAGKAMGRFALKALFGAGALLKKAIMGVWSFFSPMGPLGVVPALALTAGIYAAYSKANSKAPKGKASGGPVKGMNPYMVGEKGPELFIPTMGGNIIPNDRLAGGTADRVYGDTSQMDAKFDTMIGLLSQANNDRNTGNKKLGRDMEGAFQQR
jgi:hypothetical protein